MKAEKMLDLIREGEIDLEIGENGRTVLSAQPIYELRQYIAALEAGYNRQRQEKKMRTKIDEAAVRTMAERELGVRWDQVIKAVYRDTAKKVECAVLGADSVLYGNCPTCAAMVNEQKNDFCNFCGQLLDWG